MSSSNVPVVKKGAEEASDSTASAAAHSEPAKILPQMRSGSGIPLYVDLRIPKPKIVAEKCTHFGVLRKPIKEKCPKYIWWECPNCLYEIAVPEGAVPEFGRIGPIPRSTSSPSPSQHDLAIVSPDVQAPSIGHGNVETEAAEETDGRNRSFDEKIEAYHQIIIGQENASDHADEIRQIGDTDQDLASKAKRMSSSNEPVVKKGAEEASDSTASAAAHDSDQSAKILPQKRSGSGISLYVDLRIPKPKTVAEKCQHFGVLRKPIKEKCPKYIWWECPNCLYEIAVPEEAVPEFGRIGPITGSTSAPAPSQNNLAIVSADVQAPLMGHENVEMKVVEETDGCNRLSDEKTEAYHQIVLGMENASDHANEIHQIGDTDRDLSRDEPVQQERDADSQVNINSRNAVLFDPSVPRPESQVFDFMGVGRSHTEFLDPKAIIPYDGQRGVDHHHSNKGNPSSRSGGILARNSHPRRKPRKVRLLADLLGNNIGKSVLDLCSKDSPSNQNDNVGSVTNLQPRKSLIMPSDSGKKLVERDFLNVINTSDSESEGNERCILPFSLRRRGVPLKEHSAKKAAYVGESRVVAQKPTLDQDSVEGTGLRTANEKGSRRIESLRKKVDCRSNSGDGSCSLRGKMDCSETRKNEQNRGTLIDVDSLRPSSDKREEREDCQNGINSDDIREIVEFMAKNQYERNNRQSESVNITRNLDTDHALSKANKTREIPSLQKEQPSSSRGKTLPPDATSDMIPTGSNVVPTRVDISDNRSDVFNMGERETPHFSSMPEAISQSQPRVSSIVTPISGMETIRNKLLGNCEWRDKARAYMSSYTTTSFSKSFGHPQSNCAENEARHSWSPLTHNHEALRENTPQNFQNESRNLDIGKSTADFDLNVEDCSGASPEEQKKTASTELPFLTKGKEMELNLKGKGTLDASYPRKTIPAMTLPRLINSGFSSSSKSFDLDGKNSLKRPMPSYSNQLSNFDVNGNVNFLEKSLFPKIGVRVGPGESSRHLTSDNLRNNCLQGKFSKCPPAFPVINPFASLFGNSETGERSIGIMQGVARPMINDRSRNDLVCTMNKNPADFTLPEPGNRYMITGEDLINTERVRKYILDSLKGRKGGKNPTKAYE